MKNQQAFSLIEISIVLVIVSIIVGYSVALLPRQQELKQFKTAKSDLLNIQQSLYAFAQVNGYLPCPAFDDSGNTSNGFECRNNLGTCDSVDASISAAESCHSFSGFVPAKTLGINTPYSSKGLMLDPWAQPYRYQITNTDNGGSFNGSSNGLADFTFAGEMKVVGIGLLSPNLDVCNAETTATTDCDNSGERILKNAPVVIFSTGKNRTSTTLQDENIDGDTVFIATTYSDSYDDIVKWLSPNILYSKMIDAGQF